MSGEVIRIDNINLATLIKKELEKKGIKKMGLIGLMRFWNFKTLKKKN